MNDGVVERLVILLGVDVDKQSFVEADNAVSGLASAALAAAAAVFGLVASVAAAGDEILSTARKVQVSTDTLTEFYHVADDLGASAEAVESGFRFLNRSIAEASEGSEDARKAFKAVGLSMRDIRELPIDEVLTLAADGFQRLETDAKRTKIAMQLFGRGGVELLPVLMAGSREIEALREEARDLGLVFRQEDAEAADLLNDTLGKLSGIAQGLARRLGVDLIPHVQRLADATLEWWKANREVVLQHLDRLASDIGRAIDALNTPLGKTVALFTALAGAKGFADIAGNIPAVKALMGALAPIGGYAIAAAALYLAFDDLRTAAEGGDSAIGRLAEKMGVGGEFDLAARNVKGLLDESWGVLPETLDAIAQAFDDVTASVAAMVETLTGAIPDWLKTLLTNGARGAVNTALGLPRDFTVGGALGAIGETTGRAAEGFRAFASARSASSGDAVASRAVDALFYRSLRDAIIPDALQFSGRDTSGAIPFLRSTGSARSAAALQSTVVVNLNGDRLAPGDAQQIRQAVTGGILDAADQNP